MINVYIDGSAGTTGLRIHERLANRSDVTVTALPDVLRKDPAARKQALNSCDVAFLCLPDDAAIEAVSMIENPDVTVIDASTAHRTKSDWAYGFPELSAAHLEKLKNSKRIAVPGCHASGLCAIVYPLTASGLMPADYPLVCHSLTGYSGGGKKMIADYENPDRSVLLDAPRAYGLSQKHKHLPEMQAVCGLAQPPVFTPIVSDFYSGMEVTVGLHTALLNGVTLQQVHELYQKHYENQSFVRVLPLGADAEGGFLAANALSGKDYMEITVCGNDERILVSARFDNLGKGASGAAVECMNIACGLDAATGLVL